TPVVAEAVANALRKSRGTGQAALIVGTAAACRAGGFAFELSSLVDSATTVSSTSASTTARTLRQAAGLRFGGSLRRVLAPLCERTNWRSISESVRHDTRAGPYPRSGLANGTGLLYVHPEVGRQRKGRSMTKTRFTLLLAAAALMGLFLAAGVRAEPPGGEGEGGEKTPFVRAAAPGAKHNWSFECTATSGGVNTKLDC